MALISPPAPPRTEPYFKTQYRCTNEKCGRKGWFTNPKRRTCPKCFAHIEVIDVKRVIPKELYCHYCKRRDCSAIHV